MVRARLLKKNKENIKSSDFIFHHEIAVEGHMDSKDVQNHLIVEGVLSRRLGQF